MLQRNRTRIAAAVTAAALAVTAFAATVQAQVIAGDLAVHALPGAVVDRGGTITLRARYSCSQYEAPYNGSDIFVASITSSGTGGYDTFVSVLCDAADHQITLSLQAFNGGLSGPANLQLGHQGFSPGGTTGTISVYLDVPVRVVVAGGPSG